MTPEQRLKIERCAHEIKTWAHAVGTGHPTLSHPAPSDPPASVLDAYQRLRSVLSEVGIYDSLLEDQLLFGTLSTPMVPLLLDRVDLILRHVGNVKNLDSPTTSDTPPDGIN